MEVSEEMKRGFVPKMQTFIRLSQEYATEERLQEAFADFKRAKKQELLLVCFLDLSHALNPALTVEVSKRITGTQRLFINDIDGLLKRESLKAMKKKWGVCRFRYAVCNLSVRLVRHRKSV